MDPGDSFLMLIVLPEMNTGKMRIPPALRSKLRGLADSVVILRDRYMNMWRVGLSRLGRDWYFDNGWENFYEENELELGDSLMFEYKGRKLFNFKLFGESAVEKKGVGGLRVKEEDMVEEDEKEEEDGDGDEENDLCSKVKEEVMDDEDKEEEYDDEEEGYEDEEQEDDEDEDEEDKDDEKEYEDEEQEEDEEDEEEMSDKDMKPKFMSPPSHSGKRKLSKGNKNGAATTKRRCNQNHCYGAEIFESGLIPGPKNPYFVSRSRKESRENELLIPKIVIEDYCLNLPEKLFLVDKKGKQWETKIMRWKDGRVCLSKGWRGLCRMNSIKREDVCIIEFVPRENDKTLDILVYALD